MSNDGGKWERGIIEKKERREFEILFMKLSNVLKVYRNDVTRSLNGVEITLNFCASEDFCCSETTLMN